MGGQVILSGPLPGGDDPVGPGATPEDDFDDGHFEWLVQEMEAGRLRPPPESAIEGPAVSVSLGDACDVDPGLLAAVCGPDGLGGQAVSAAFGQDRAADVLCPGPILAALTAQAVSRVVPQPVSQPAVSRIVAGPGSRPGSLTDDELIGVLQATRRLVNLASWQQTVVIAEFARRRQAQFEAAKARGVPVGCRDGEFPGEELAMELVDTGPYTSARIDTAIELTARLPLTLAGMADGTIDLARACAIASRTQSMTDADAAYADALLATAAPGLRPDQLARKADALERKLAPEAVAARKKLARQLHQRVEARREESGNASLAGRELDTTDVIASRAYIDALAVRLRNSGLIGGTLNHLRALVLVDLTQGRNPLDRITPRPAPAPASEAGMPGGEPSTAHDTDDNQAPGQPAAGPVGENCAAEQTADQADGGAVPVPSGSPSADPPGRTPDPVGASVSAATTPADDRSDDDSLRHDPPRPSGPVPLPALINLLVPAGTLLGWSTAPGQAAGWGLLDADETRTLIQAASQHPRTRWCFTLTAPDGTAVAHACATGRHLQKPLDLQRPSDPQSLQSQQSQQKEQESGGRLAARQTAQLVDFLRSFNITFEPIARDNCDHRHAEDRYVPSRKLKHLLRARNQTCTAPACNAQALYCDIDHTVPYPDGPTDECNANPKCRRHHRTKQASGWTSIQPTPDTTIWTTPSGRTHSSTPTAYDL